MYTVEMVECNIVRLSGPVQDLTGILYSSNPEWQ